MIEKLKYIELGEEKYPIKCDLAVLEEIQEKYGTINAFELKLAGWVKNEEKKLVKTEPSMKAIRFVLPLMINEGIDIENAKNGKKRKHITDAELRELCTGVNVFDVANELHDEFSRCFEVKNQSSTQEQGETPS